MKKNNIVDRLKFILGLGWFVGSIFGMFYFKSLYSCMILGQYLLVMSIPFLRQAEDFESKFIPFLFMFTGIGCIIIPFFIMNPDVLNIKIDWDLITTILLSLLFLITVWFMTFYSTYKDKRLSKKCTVFIDAKIIGYEKFESDGGKDFYLTRYHFIYDGRGYKVSGRVHIYKISKKVGTLEKIKINPNNPKEIIENTTNLQETRENNIKFKDLLLVFIKIIGVLIPITILILYINVIIHYR